MKFYHIALVVVTGLTAFGALLILTILLMAARGAI